MITIIITLCNNSSDCNSKTLSNDVTQGRNEGMNSRGCKFCSSHVIRQTWKNRRQQSNNKTSENPTKFQKIDIKSYAIANFFKKSRGAAPPPHPPPAPPASYMPDNTSAIPIFLYHIKHMLKVNKQQTTFPHKVHATFSSIK